MRKDYKKRLLNSRRKWAHWTSNQLPIRNVIIKAQQWAWWIKNI